MKQKQTSRWTPFLPYIKNKYTLTLLGFLVWLAFFDRNDFITTWSYHRQLNKLEQEKAFYDSEIAKNRMYLNELRTNNENLEKYGREKYFMKRDNEDVFVIVDNRDSDKTEN
ncbi:MAG: septum formation initiator family protein [Bacteroidia bacterium]|nr:septum formation initiator family protein [Bacteroidia bacterium]